MALGAVFAFVLGALAWSPVRRLAAAVQVLTALSAPGHPGVPADQSTTDLVLSGAGAPVPARLYEPRGPIHRCVVVGHGVHYLGIDEPRLQRFSRALASAGVLVLTPELAELADYRITRTGADVLGSASRYLAARCSAGHRVGLLGFSFAGGLALLAAADPANAGVLAYVASVGGYDDLERVLRFLVTGEVIGPDGVQRRTANEYGLVVLLYGYLEKFVPEVDIGVARRAVRAWLHEERPRAWAEASRRETFEAERLFIRLSGGHIGEVGDDVAALIRRHGEALAALSPRGHFSRISVPVYLLHGVGDSVIPAEETLWADRELGSRPHYALVTPLIEHVEVSGTPNFRDQFALVAFMARLL
jgi:pimeloyl-ACP methyl ester carboxylesterase